MKALRNTLITQWIAVALILCFTGCASQTNKRPNRNDPYWPDWSAVTNLPPNFAAARLRGVQRGAAKFSRSETNSSSSQNNPSGNTPGDYFRAGQEAVEAGANLASNQEGWLADSVRRFLEPLSIIFGKSWDDEYLYIWGHKDAVIASVLTVSEHPDVAEIDFYSQNNATNTWTPEVATVFASNTVRIVTHDLQSTNRLLAAENNRYLLDLQTKDGFTIF